MSRGKSGAMITKACTPDCVQTGLDYSYGQYCCNQDACNSAGHLKLKAILLFVFFFMVYLVK